MSAENPDLSERTYEMGEDDIDLSVEIIKLEKEQRRKAFDSLDGKLGTFKQSGKGSLFFRTYIPGARSRDALVVWHPQVSANLPVAVRLIVSDEVSVTTDGRQEQFVTSQEYTYKPMGRLIVAKTCMVARSEDGKWQIGHGEFMLQKPTDEPTTYIYHGLEYGMDFPRDNPQSSASELTARREAAENMTTILASLPSQEAVPTEYLFSLVTQ
jgi:hypothetical protein